MPAHPQEPAAKPAAPAAEDVLADFKRVFQRFASAEEVTGAVEVKSEDEVRTGQPGWGEGPPERRTGVLTRDPWHGNGGGRVEWQRNGMEMEEGEWSGSGTESSPNVS